MRPDDATQPNRDDRLGLDQFSRVRAEPGLSLEELGRALADVLDGGLDPYGTDRSPNAEAPDPPDSGVGVPDAGTDVPCELTPAGVVEAILFVGHPNNEPMTAASMAGLMRGVRATEIGDLVAELNASYERDGHPYRIVPEGAGYRLELCDEFAALRDAFHGRVRDARLSQAAIDILAIVAYRPGLTRGEVDELRGKPSGALLSNLVRRDLLRIERRDTKGRAPHYFVTGRFLELFRLATLDELPRGEDDERML